MRTKWKILGAVLLVLSISGGPFAESAYRKLLKNVDIASGAAIAFSKMAALTASKALETTAGGVVTASSFAPATAANTASSLMARDGSGQVAATTFTGAVTGNVTGNLTGNVTGNTAGTHTGAVVGNADTATVSTTAATTTKSDNVSYFPVFVSANSSSSQAIKVGSMSYNPSTNTLTATTFAGNASTATAATTASTVTTNANLTGAVTSSGNATTLVWETTGHIETPTAKTYVLDQSAAFAYTINTLIVATASGTISAAVKINGTNVTGISAVSVSSTPATGTASAANTVSIGDKVTLVLSSNSSSADLSFTLKATR